MFRYHMQLATPSPSLPSPPRTTSRFALVTVKVYLADRGFVFQLPACVTGAKRRGKEVTRGTHERNYTIYSFHSLLFYQP